MSCAAYHTVPQQNPKKGQTRTLRCCLGVNLPPTPHHFRGVSFVPHEVGGFGCVDVTDEVLAGGFPLSAQIGGWAAVNI